MNGNLILLWICILQKISRYVIRIGEQNQLLNYRIPKLAHESHLGCLYFVLILSLILPIMKNTFIVPNVSQLQLKLLKL